MRMGFLVIVISVFAAPVPIAAQAQTGGSKEPPAQAPPGNATPQQPTTEAPPKPWWERLTFYGDLRARYEGFFQDETETRQRERFRFRIGVRTAIAEGLDFNFRLGSGDPADVTST